VIENDVEDHVHVARVSFAHELLQVFAGAEARIDFEKVLNAVAVIAVGFFRAVFKNRAEPDRVGAEGFDVVQTARDALEIAALKNLPLRRIAALGRRVAVGPQPSAVVVEAIHQQKINEHIAPVCG